MLKQLVEQVLGREIGLVSYGGLKAKVDEEVRREAMLLSWTASAMPCYRRQVTRL
jgi:hypothetical protein